MSHFLREEAILILLTFLPLFQCFISTPANPFFKCSDHENSTASSAFEDNLRTLPKNLIDHENLHKKGFFKKSMGEKTNQVSGLGFCRDDPDPNTCQNCIQSATKEIIEKCPKNKSAITWNDGCILQYYSNEQFLSLSNSKDEDRDPHPNYRSNSHDLEASLFFFITQLSLYTELDPSDNMSATGEMLLGTLQQHVRGTVQCSRDLSTFNCTNCLLGLLADTSEFSDCSNYRLFKRNLIANCAYLLEYRFFWSSCYPTHSPPQVTDPNSVTPSRRTADNSLTWGYTIAIVVSMTLASILVIYIGVACLFKRQKDKEDHRVIQESGSAEPSEWGSRQPLTFNLNTILTATSNFSDASKIRESSFGPVYKGTLLDGREIAVKRLLWNSGQGVEQLKNEVALTAHLEQRNLVKLLGCCMEGDEKLLVYEYVSDNSLDHILSDPAKRGQFGWNARYTIIKGIAKGLQYLHEGTPYRILHQDLKASNILLDRELCPKISEFGFARFLRGNQTAGTNGSGSVAPEHVMHEQLSVKTDVFSFGVLAIEIVKGRKRSNFTQSDQAQDLLHCTWKQWREQRVLELMDPAVVESCSVTEVLRCIHVALLCVQENPADRPTMSAVDLMLNGKTITLQPNSPPPLFMGSSLARSNPTSS